MKKIISFSFLSLLFFSCFFLNKKPSKHVKKSFNLKIGYDKNELILFSQDINNINTKIPFNVFSRSGFYYISDPNNNKILKITEKGMPILIIYNSKNNRILKPTVNKITDSSSEKLAFVKIYRDFPIFSPGLITVDISKNIYIINKHPSYREKSEDKSIADSMILKFNSNGELLYKLGKEGIDTTPFGYINDIITDEKDNLIVQEFLTNERIIYKFSADGKLQKKTKITSNNLPLTKEEIDYISNIVNIKLGSKENDLYITYQYIKELNKNFSITTYEIMYEKLHKYSLELDKHMKLLHTIYPETFDISNMKKNKLLTKLHGNNKKITKPLKNLIGINNIGNMYFIQKSPPIGRINDNEQKLLIYNKAGKLKKNITFSYPLDIQYASKVILSPDGNLFSYYIKNGEIQFVTID